MTPPTADRFAKPRSIACEDATTQLFLHVRECKDVATGAPESFELQAQMIATGSAAQCAAHAIDCVGAVARAAKCAHALGDAKLAIPDARGDDAACGAVRDVFGDDDYSLAQYATCYGALDKVGSGRGGGGGRGRGGARAERVALGRTGAEGRGGGQLPAETA